MNINTISLYNPKILLNKRFQKQHQKQYKNVFQNDLKNISYSKNYYLNQISFGKKITQFNSIDEANKYFFDNYGAISDFGSIEQAKTMDYAIKDFLSKTKINNSDKLFLDGIEIASADRNSDSCLKIAAKIKYGYNFDDKTEELYETYQKAGKVKEFIEIYNPEVIRCSILRLGMVLDDNADWGQNNLEKNKEVIQEELVTLLNLKNSPFDYVTKNMTYPNEEEFEITKEVINDRSATKNDFLEQYALKRLEGKNFSPEVTKLYREFGGANLFSEWTDYDFAGVQFKSLKEAKKYFKDEYGIVADFTDLEQAYTVKMAIDDFLKLDTIKDKKFLKGVKIKIKDKTELDKGSNAEVQVSDYEWIYNDDIKGLFEKYQLEGREWEFYREIRPDKINIKGITLCLKSDFGWEAKPKGKSYMADTSRNVIHHEIGHILHLKNDPWKYIIYHYDKAMSKPEYNAMKCVSSYATTNKTEFVAEYIANRLKGKTFNDEVVQLYRSLGGPNLFHDW